MFILLISDIIFKGKGTHSDIFINVGNSTFVEYSSV